MEHPVYIRYKMCAFSNTFIKFLGNFSFLLFICQVQMGLASHFINDKFIIALENQIYIKMIIIKMKFNFDTESSLNF